MSSRKRYEFVEIVIPAGSTQSRFIFPDIPQLRNDTTQDIIIQGLESYSILTLPLSPISTNPVATMAQLQSSFLTLYIKNEESVRLVPLIRLLGTFTSLATSASQQWYDPFDLQNVQVDWNKTYISTPAPYGNVGAFSIVLGVDYKKLQPGAWQKMTAGTIPGWND